MCETAKSFVPAQRDGARHPAVFCVRDVLWFFLQRKNKKARSRRLCYSGSKSRQPVAIPGRRAARFSCSHFAGYGLIINTLPRSGTKVSALSVAAGESPKRRPSVKNGAGLLANPRQAPVLARASEGPAVRVRMVLGTFCHQKVQKFRPIGSGSPQPPRAEG